MRDPQAIWSPRADFRHVVAAAALTSLLPACGGGALSPAAAVGKVGSSLSAQSQMAPQGAEICQLNEALKQQPPGRKTPLSEPCQDAFKSDRLWRGAMVTLAAYGDHVEAVAAGADPATSGQLQAALTGVRGPNWIDVEEGKEKAARDAVAELVKQMDTSEGGLEEVVQAAAPHVKTICDGLEPYLDAQAQSLAGIRKDVDGKQISPATRRCTMLDNRPVCVSNSVADRIFYATASGHLTALEHSHVHARNTVGAFCAAHAKLQKAADDGNFEDESTHREIADAVKNSHGAEPQAESPSGDAPTE